MLLNKTQTHKMPGEKARWELYKKAVCFEQILEAASYKIAVVWPLTFHCTSHQDERDILGTAGEVRKNS